MGMASGIIVGQSLGARKPERADETIRWAAYVALITAAFSGLVIAFPVHRAIRPSASVMRAPLA